MDIFHWIIQELAPEKRTSADLLYEHMDSQSGRCLPIIYQPFDATNRGHWRDRGAALDFVLATRSEGKRVLDFGAGDGWPSLIIARFVKEVIGVEGAHRRVRVCRENGARLGIQNAAFEYVAPGTPLPFPDNSFDAIVAASSVEQTPDPRTTLAEFYRVLRPGGRARLYYEALGRYRGGSEQETWLWQVDEVTTKLMLYERHIDEEFALQIALTYELPKDELTCALGQGDSLDVQTLNVEKLALIQARLVDAGMYTTQHPSGPTLHRWLLETGFGDAYGSHSAIHVAGCLFDALPEGERPTTLPEIDGYLRPIAEVIVELRAPLAWDPMITAVK